MQNSHIKNTIKVSDNFYGQRKRFIYLSFALYEIIAILLASNFNFNGWNVVSRTLQVIAGGITAVILLCDFIKKRIKINVFTIVCGISFALTTYFARTTQLAFFFVFMCALGGYDFDEFVKFALKILVVIVALVVLCSIIGVIPETESIRGNEYRISLGFRACTLPASLFMFIVLTYNYLKKEHISYALLIIEIIVAGLIFYFTKARTGLALTIVIVVCSLLSKVFSSKKSLKDFRAKKLLQYCLMALPVLFMLVYGVACVLFDIGEPLAQKVNGILSNRLKFTVGAFENHSITLFGQEINWFNASGGYIGVDCSYFYFLFTYGIINTAILLAGSTYLIFYGIKKKNYWLVFAFVICLIDGIVEPYLDDFKYNFFSLALSPFILGGTYYCKNRFGVPNDNCANETLLSGKSVIVVLVTFNRKSILKESLLALLKSDYEYFKILVVDNASTDGTYEYITDLFDDNADKILYVNTGKNLGGAGGFNFGIKKALEMNADYIWLMDDDCIVRPDALSVLVDKAHNINDDFGYLSSKVLWKDGSLSKMNIQRRNLTDKKFDCEKSGQKIKLASFVSLFLNGKVVEKVGLPYKDFFIWGDDWEYTYRISERFDCYYVAESIVDHQSNSNIGADISCDADDRLNRYFYYYRNEGFFYRKSGLFGLFYYLFKVAYHFIKITFSKCKCKKQRYGILFKGFFASFAFNPKIEYGFGADSKINVLEFFGEPISYGGQESVVKNLYENSEWNNIKFTFCTPFICNNTDFINSIEKRGDKIIADGKKFASKFRKLSIISTAENIFFNERFDVVHIHAGSVFSLAVMAKAAKRAGVKKVVVHAHSGGINRFSYRLVKKYSDLMLNKYADVFLCCSKIAAGWKFPKSVIDENQYLFLKNGIKTDKFTFSEKQRIEYRKKLCLQDVSVVCQVARFAKEKNHVFTLKILKALKDKGVLFKALIIGDGPLKKDFENGVASLGLNDNVIYFEKRNDIPQILFASDVFILPSLYEGLPVAGIEAQAAGLLTLMSDKIAPETKVIDLAQFLPINYDTDAEIWATEIANRKKVPRETYVELVRAEGFDIKDSAAYLEQIYRGYK